MHHETADKFHTGDCDGFFLPSFVILCTKSHFCLRHLLDSGICDGNPVCVAAEVFHGIPVSIEGFLDLRVPLLFVQAVFKFSPYRASAQFLAGNRDIQSLFLVKQV